MVRQTLNECIPLAIDGSTAHLPQGVTQLELEALAPRDERPLVVVGVGTMTYTVLLVATFILEGQLNEAVGLRRLRHKVQRLHNHFVLCGYGRVGREIARQFAVGAYLVESRKSKDDNPAKRNKNKN